MEQHPQNFKTAGISIVGVLVTLGIISIGIYALMDVMEQFLGTSRKIENKESVVQEATKKAAALQMSDFLKLEEICTEYALEGLQPGDCNNENSTSTHPFLYHWYDLDGQTKICIELTKCRPISNGKMRDVVVTAYHKTKGILSKAPLSFRKAK